MIKYEIITTDTFEKELQNIFHYINFHMQEPIIAKNLYNKIINSISKLNYFPERYFKLKNCKTANVHRLIVNNYVIIYKISSLNHVYILHIFHGNQNYLNLL